MQQNHIDEEVEVEQTFGISVNDKDYSKVNLKIETELKSSNSEIIFLSVSYLGLFDTDNEKPELSITEIEKPELLLNKILPDMSSLIADITNRCFGNPLELPKKLPDNISFKNIE
ncbi:hypothetical protein ACTMD7_00040 (plasmid) [Enterococcus faecalis]|uniref:hypothetical protein n=1 Tax=Enterococcus faecalis TaxID=1351 RepID=UPI003F8E6C6D